MKNYSVSFTNKNNLLSELSYKYGSDKGSSTEDIQHPSGWNFHKYTQIYDFILNGIRNTATDILECGIGTNNPNVESSMGINGTPGASLRMWRDYFPNANIIGIDIDPGIMFKEERIETFVVDQADTRSINEFKNKIDVKFDLILDDGLHAYHAQQNLFDNTFDLVKDGGLYIIEDCGSSFDPLLNYLKDKGHQYLGFDANHKYDSFIVIKKEYDGKSKK